MSIAKLDHSQQTILDQQSWLSKIKRWAGWNSGESTSALYAIHTDHLGTPRRMTDAQQRLVWRAEYSSFGKAKVTSAKVTLNLRLPGQYFDAETGTHYNYFRDYDPKVGRYLTSDPIGLSGGVNGFAYSAADPIRFYDPLGLRKYQIGSADPNVVRDAGSGKWNSIQATLTKRLQKKAIQSGMGVFGWPHAAAQLNHYFDNSGSNLTIDLAAMLRDVKSTRDLRYEEEDAAINFADGLDLKPGSCTSITSSEASGGSNRKTESPDWYYAVGGYSAWGKGNVSVDALGNYTMRYEYKFFDRYNWDSGKSVDIAGIKVTDAFMGDFHRMGLAKEYDVYGSVKRKITWTKGKKSIKETEGW